MDKRIKGKKYRLVIDGKSCIGIYVRSEKYLYPKKKHMPVFKVGKKYIRGWECFWLPLEIALKLENAADKFVLDYKNKASKNAV